MCVCVYVRIYVRIYVCVYAVYIYVCVCVYTYVFMQYVSSYMNFPALTQNADSGAEFHNETYDMAAVFKAEFKMNT